MFPSVHCLKHIKLIIQYQVAPIYSHWTIFFCFRNFAFIFFSNISIFFFTLSRWSTMDLLVVSLSIISSTFLSSFTRAITFLVANENCCALPSSVMFPYLLWAFLCSIPTDSSSFKDRKEYFNFTFPERVKICFKTFHIVSTDFFTFFSLART